MVKVPQGRPRGTLRPKSSTLPTDNFLNSSDVGGGKTLTLFSRRQLKTFKDSFLIFRSSTRITFDDLAGVTVDGGVPDDGVPVLLLSLLIPMLFPFLDLLVMGLLLGSFFSGRYCSSIVDHVLVISCLGRSATSESRGRTFVEVQHRGGTDDGELPEPIPFGRVRGSEARGLRVCRVIVSRVRTRGGRFLEQPRPAR